MLFWQSHEDNFQCIAVREREVSEGKEEKRTNEAILGSNPVKRGEGQPNSMEVSHGEMIDLDKPSPAEPFNPYEGYKMAKQLDESIDVFLSRLPPSSISVAFGPWIWIANPHSRRRPLQQDITGFKAAGTELLEEYLARKTDVESRNPDRAPATITKLLKVSRERLKESIFSLAQSKGLMSGKWMLFASKDNVDDMWFKVAKATLTGTLGCEAKVATDDDSDKVRPIFIYTEDFTDIDDVKRVLAKLQELGLVKGEQGIYYKCDAYTYLDIMSGNEYKLRASLYSSGDLLKQGNLEEHWKWR